MNKIFTLLLFLVTVSFGLQAQSAISGVINAYGRVDAIDTSNECIPFITVDDASGFTDGEAILIIQMQGAEIDTLGDVNFGSILNLQSSGVHEKNRIDYISGNDIYLSHKVFNSYDLDGSVQIVNIKEYTDAVVTATVEAMPWDGEKGGIVALDVAGSLTLNAAITATGKGFRGGERDIVQSLCNFNTTQSQYVYPDGAWEGDSKGEGIAKFVAGKENGRAPQGNGGGGGNDHNTGGGGGSNLGAGGNGGLNLDPTPLACIGQYPGWGGKNVINPGDRWFMGGGGGAGHDNDGSGSDGAPGGGIVYVKANNLVGNWNFITANGQFALQTIAFDAAGGGGGGGTVVLDVNNLIFGLTAEAKGRNGGNANAIGSTRCMGPGGGGGGGVIFNNIASSQFFPNVLGGDPGIIVNSTSPCNNTSANAQTGDPGLVLPLPALPEGDIIIHMTITDEIDDTAICDSDVATLSLGTTPVADEFNWFVDGSYIANDNSNYTGYNSPSLDISGLAAGSYTINVVAIGGCNDTLNSAMITLDVATSAEITLQPEDQDICIDEAFVLSTDATGSTLNYQWQVNDGSGWVNVTDTPPYSGANTSDLMVDANAGVDGYEFRCEVTNQCPGTATSDIATVIVDGLAIPDFTYTISNDTIFPMSTSTDNTDWYWDFGDGSPLHPAGTPYYVYSEPGDYQVTIYAVNDCGTSSETYTVTITTITDISEIVEAQFTVGPNPTRGNLFIQSNGEFNDVQITLFDVNGRVLRNENMFGASLEWNLNNLPNGMYLLGIKTEQGDTIRKILKQ